MGTPVGQARCAIALSFVFAASASASFITVPVIDPASVNDVDQSAVYFSSTGSAGPSSVIDLAAFRTSVNSAWNNNMGGVIDFEVRNDLNATPVGSLDSATQISGRYGVNGNLATPKSLQITSGSGTWVWPGATTNGRTPTSGANSLGKNATDVFDFEILLGSIINGAPNEHVTQFGFTVLERTGTNLGSPLSITATFSDGSTALARATLSGSLPANNEDAFYGFVAPPGTSIVSVVFDPINFTTIDDIAFVTALPESALPEPATPLAAVAAVVMSSLIRRRRRSPW
jgi:hypothetical protein